MNLLRWTTIFVALTGLVHLATAQTVEFELTNATGQAGDIVSVDLLVTTSFAISGGQFAIVHDPLVLQPISGSLGSGITFTPQLDFVNVNPMGGDGVLAYVIFPFTPTVTTLTPTNSPFFTLQYEILAGAPEGDTLLSFSDGVLGSPGLEIVNLVSEPDGVTIAASATTSGTVTVTPPFVGPQFIRGDCDASGSPLGLPDVIQTLSVLFQGGVAACDKACDHDGSGILSLPDVIGLLGFLFQGGAALPAPNACGEMAPDDMLTCDSFPPCDSLK